METLKAVPGHAKSEFIITGIFQGEGHEHWASFRNALLNDDNLDSLRNDKDFKWGTTLISNVVDHLLRNQGRPIDDGELTDERMCEMFVGECGRGDDDDYKAVLKLIEAFEVISHRAKFWGLNEFDLGEIKVSLETIGLCQRLILEAHHKMESVPVS